MDIQEEYDQLDYIIVNLNELTENITIKDIKEQLELIKYEAETRKEYLEDKVIELQEKEEKQANYEYERGCL